MDKVKLTTQKFIDFILNISKKIFPKKLIEIEKKFLNIEVVLYVFFGILTTLVNIGFFSLLTYTLRLEENLSNVIAILIAVLFAYFTNKGLVFNSKASTIKEKSIEFFKFMFGRAITMLVELLGFYLMFNIIGINKIISKIVITILVVILNFFISKFFAFKKISDEV